jgi:hypothetical protein
MGRQLDSDSRVVRPTGASSGRLPPFQAIMVCERSRFEELWGLRPGAAESLLRWANKVAGLPGLIGIKGD